MPERPAWFDEDLLPYPSNWIDVDGNGVHYLMSVRVRHC